MKVPQCSGLSVPDLMDQGSVSLTVDFNDGVQQPSHLQDVYRDLRLRL